MVVTGDLQPRERTRNLEKYIEQEILLRIIVIAILLCNHWIKGFPLVSLYAGPIHYSFVATNASVHAPNKVNTPPTEDTPQQFCRMTLSQI